MSVFFQQSREVYNFILQEMLFPNLSQAWKKAFNVFFLITSFREISFYGKERFRKNFLRQNIYEKTPQRDFFLAFETQTEQIHKV